MKHRVYLALGSNLGDGKANLDKAVGLIAKRIGDVEAVSTYLVSEPWGFESSNMFTNGALALTTELDPFELLDVTYRTGDGTDAQASSRRALYRSDHRHRHLAL